MKITILLPFIIYAAWVIREWGIFTLKDRDNQKSWDSYHITQVVENFVLLAIICGIFIIRWEIGVNGYALFFSTVLVRLVFWDMSFNISIRKSKTVKDIFLYVGLPHVYDSYGRPIKDNLYPKLIGANKEGLIGWGTFFFIKIIPLTVLVSIILTYLI